MYIEFKNRKLRKQCEDWKTLVRQWGDERARKIRTRLDDIKAAENLDELLRIPGTGCHPLKQDRKGQYAVKLNGPYRIVFVPTEDREPIEVTSVKILEVGVDYH